MAATPVFQTRDMFRAKTNAERQREFRRRNPGYYRRLHAEHRARVKALVLQAKLVAQMAEQVAMKVAVEVPAPELAFVFPMSLITSQFQRQLVEVEQGS